MSEDFETLTRGYGDEGLDLGELQAALIHTRFALPAVDNVGRSADDRNAYVLIDRMVRALLVTFPDSRCGATCGDCCTLSRALIRIFRSEWEVLHDYLLANRDEAELAQLRARFEQACGPYLPQLEGYQAMLDSGARPRPEPHELPIRCPLLEGEACGVYPVRPAICRAYGHFALTDAEGTRTGIFACQAQRAVLKKQLQGLELPSFNPLYQAIADSCQEEEKRLIPLWFARSFPSAGGPA